MKTVHDIIALMGQKSTTPEVAALFAAAGLGKPPKTVNANQSSKSFDDKTNQLSFSFKFDITNDQFYPPVSPKNDDYNFESYLSTVVLFSAGSRRKKVADPKPASFWEGFVSPDASYDSLLNFIGTANSTDKRVLSKSLNEVTEIRIWVDEDSNAIATMELRLKESREIFSQYSFVEKYTLNKVKSAYTLLVKWLFDNKYLLLPKEIYQESLPADHASILTFTDKYLRNHIWTDQLIADDALVSFLYKIASNRTLQLPDGGSMNVYIKHLFIKSAGQWDNHQDIYQNGTSEELDAFEGSIVLNESQQQHFLQTLTQTFELFKQIPKENFF